VRVYSGFMTLCPGFGQDRVNFHQTPGRGTAGRADPTWPNRTGYSIPCHAGFRCGGAGRGELTLGSGARGSSVRESGSLGRAVCVVFSPHLYRCSCSLCLLFC